MTAIRKFAASAGGTIRTCAFHSALDGRIDVVDLEVNGPVLGIEAVVVHCNGHNIAWNGLLRKTADVAR